MSTKETIDRHFPVAGMGILVLTAANWLTSTRTEPVKRDLDTSLWGMLAVVNHRIEFAAFLAVAVITLAAVTSLTFALHKSRVAVTTLSVLAAVAAALVMVSTDGGFSPGPGAWLTVILCVATALLSGISTAIYRDRTRAPAALP